MFNDLRNHKRNGRKISDFEELIIIYKKSTGIKESKQLN